MNITYKIIEYIFLISVVAYALAFYFKRFSYLIEKQGGMAFIFFHSVVIYVLYSVVDVIVNKNNQLITTIFALVFLFRFFRKEHV